MSSLILGHEQVERCQQADDFLLAGFAGASDAMLRQTFQQRLVDEAGRWLSPGAVMSSPFPSGTDEVVSTTMVAIGCRNNQADGR